MCDWHKLYVISITHDFHVALLHTFYLKYVIYHAESKSYVWLK